MGRKRPVLLIMEQIECNLANFDTSASDEVLLRAPVTMEVTEGTAAIELQTRVQDFLFNCSKINDRIFLLQKFVDRNILIDRYTVCHCLVV